MFCALSAAVYLWPLEVATVRLPRQNDRLITAMLWEAGDQIRLRYRHSVELTWVEGRFAVGPDLRLLAVETRMQSVGSGLPNAFFERTQQQDDLLVVDEKRKPIGSLRFYLVPVNQTHLTVAGQTVDVAGFEAGTLIEVAAQKAYLLDWFLWRVAGIAFD